MVDEPGVAFPIVFRERVRKGEVPFEVFVLFGNLVEVIDVERFAKTTRAVPERDLSVRFQASVLLKNPCH